MTVLLLRLVGPLQAWGERSRFTRRETGSEPTKSGVVGLLAAALGRGRADPVEDLGGLAFGVRVDRPGTVMADFQTARSLDGRRSMPLSMRYYLSDAVFLAAVEGDETFLTELDVALRDPVYPLYLGRRSCPPAEPIRRQTDSLRSGPLLEVLSQEPLTGPDRYLRKQPRLVQVNAAVDLGSEGDGTILSDRQLSRLVRDFPVSFDPRQREYGFREVVRGALMVPNPEGIESVDSHNPMIDVGGY